MPLNMTPAEFLARWDAAHEVGMASNRPSPDQPPGDGALATLTNKPGSKHRRGDDNSKAVKPTFKQKANNSTKSRPKPANPPKRIPATEAQQQLPSPAAASTKPLSKSKQTSKYKPRQTKKQAKNSKAGRAKQAQQQPMAAGASAQPLPLHSPLLITTNSNYRTSELFVTLA